MAANQGRVIAPALGAAAVLIAAIGLSQELLMFESPAFQFTPARQRVIGELSKVPVSAAPLDHFADKLSMSGARRKRQEAREADLMSPEGSDSSYAPRPGPDTGLGSGRDDRERSQERLNEIRSEMARAEAWKSKSSDSANKVAHDISVLPESQSEIEYETPAEEIVRSQAPATTQLRDRDGELNAPGKHEHDEVAQFGEIEVIISKLKTYTSSRQRVTGPTPTFRATLKSVCSAPAWPSGTAHGSSTTLPSSGRLSR